VNVLRKWVRELSAAPHLDSSCRHRSENHCSVPNDVFPRCRSLRSLLGWLGRVYRGSALYNFPGVHVRYDFERKNAAVWSIRLAALLLIATLAWDALDPGLRPSTWFVLGSNFLLGLVITAAFPRAAVGVFLALVVSILLELLQSLVPERDVRGIEIVAKWLCAFGGAMTMLIIAFFSMGRRS
jgi:hypothetical protein